jgi:predicted Zn-dependent protease with MMP-like domain
MFPVARHKGVVPVEMDAERFGEIVEQALDEIPPGDRRAGAQPGRPRRGRAAGGPARRSPGLYDGVALTHRDSWGAPDDR